MHGGRYAFAADRPHLLFILRAEIVQQAGELFNTGQRNQYFYQIVHGVLAVENQRQ